MKGHLCDHFDWLLTMGGLIMVFQDRCLIKIGGCKDTCHHVLTTYQDSESIKK